MIKRILIICILLLYGIFLYAQNSNAEKVFLIPTIDYAINDKWYKTISKNAPKIIPVEKVVKGQKFYIMIFLLKYAKDYQNKTNVVYDLKVIKPSGSEYFNQTNIPALNKVIKNDLIMMSENNLYVSFDPPDEFGKYQIEATIKDLIDKSETKIVKTIELVENKKINNFLDDESFSKWMMGNFDNPEPEKMINGLFYYLNSSLSKKDSTYPPVLGFTVTLLKDNPYLFSELLNEYKNSEMRQKIFVLNILQYFEDNDEVKAFLNNLPKDEIKLYNKNNSTDKLFTINSIFDPSQLDALWGAFFGSGKYEFILALLNTLNLKNDNKMVYQAALWSIKSNYQNNYLVKSYCDYIYNYEKISGTVKKELGTIVDVKK